MLVGLDILRQIEDIIDRAYTDFTYRLVGAEFLTTEQKTQVEALGLLVGQRPLIELLYLLIRQINSPNYRKDKGLQMLLDEIALSGVLPTLRDTDKYTLDHAKASVNEAIQLSKNELKKQIKHEILKINTQYKEDTAINQLSNLPERQKKIEDSSNKLLKGLAYAAVGATAFRLFRREFTTSMTQLVNSAIIDQLTNPLLSVLSQTQQQDTDPLVWKEVVKDDRLSEECRRLHTHPDWTPRIYRLSELVKNGTNVGRPKSQWKAVVGGTHPNCRCVLRPATEEMLHHGKQKKND